MRRRVIDIYLQISYKIRQGEVRQSEETSERYKTGQSVSNITTAYVPVISMWSTTGLSLGQCGVFICHTQNISIMNFEAVPHVVSTFAFCFNLHLSRLTA